MAIDGTWEITVNSPMGVQKSTTTFQSNGATLTGTSRSPFGDDEISDGTVDGDSATWKIALTQPMPMTLAFAVTVNGDSMTGDVQAGTFGTSPVSGTRSS